MAVYGIWQTITMVIVVLLSECISLARNL